MENVPWHSDVKDFSEALALKSNGEYQVACEHAHSCCVLLAKVDKFKVRGQWFTWIDYEKFHDLVTVSSSCSFKSFLSPYDTKLLWKRRWPVGNHLTVWTTWLQPLPGPYMVQMKVGLIQVNLVTVRRDDMEQAGNLQSCEIGLS